MKKPTYIAAASLSFAATVVAAAERDEVKAAEYLYCGRVAAVAMSVANQRGDQWTANGFRQMRTHFLIAAALKSDGDFIKREIPKAIQKFDEQHLNAEGGAQLLAKQTEECSGIWYKEVRSLIGFDRKQSGSEGQRAE